MGTYIRKRWLLIGLFAGVISTTPVRAQMFANPTEVIDRADNRYLNSVFNYWDEVEKPPVSRTPRLRMFGMPAGFIMNPMGIHEDDDVEPWAKDTGPSNIQFVLGNDNPYLDPLRPGGIGGVGFYRLYSQFQCFDTGSTSVCLNLQGFAPLGAQFDGLPTGPAVFSPAVAWFQELGNGTAVQGFVSQNVKTMDSGAWARSFSTRTFYGMAFQCPIPTFERQGPSNVFFFVEAIGGLRLNSEGTYTWREMQLLPGIQWRLNDTCWLSLGGTRHGLVTCSWQF
jgi:hypothetical protein